MIVRTCAHPGCTVLTIGSRCLLHEEPVTRTFVRGRPYPVATTGQHRAAALLPAGGSAPVVRAQRVLTART